MGPNQVCRVLPLAMVASLCACSPTVTFDVPLQSDTEVEGAGLLGQVLNTFPAFDELSSFDISASDEFENNNTQKDQVREARLKSFALSVVAPADGTLDFLDEIAFFVEAPGQSRARIASKAIPDGAREVELDLDELDLAPYVRAESMTFTTEISGRSPEDDTTVRANLVVEVTAGL